MKQRRKKKRIDIVNEQRRIVAYLDSVGAGVTVRYGGGIVRLVAVRAG